MTSVFLDTGYLAALEAVDDQHHSDAVQHWSETASELDSIFTTTYVFDEVVTFFNNSRGRHQKAVDIERRHAWANRRRRHLPIDEEGRGRACQFAPAQWHLGIVADLR